MALFHDMIELCGLADGNCGTVLGVVALDGGFIGRTAADGHRLRHAVAADGLAQEAFGRPFITLLREAKVHRLPVFVHGAVRDHTSRMKIATELSCPRGTTTYENGSAPYSTPG